MAKGLWFRNRAGRKEVWIVYKDESGKKRREKVGADTPEMRQLAKQALVERQHEAQTYKFFPERKVLGTTFGEAAQRYWDLIGCNRDKSWLYRWKDLVSEFGSLRLVDVKPDIIQRWYNRRVAESKVGAGNANRSLALLSTIFNRAVDWDLFNAVNPVRKVQTQPDPEPRTRFLSKDEMLKVFDACDPRILPLVFFSLMTGLRKMEALTFRWEDVSADLTTIKAHRRKKGIFPDIPVGDKLRQLLMCLGPRKEGRLFDLCPMTFRRLFEKARKDSGVAHFTWHDLRRTFGSHFTMITKDRPSLRKLLGHRTTYMVDRYAYLDDDHLRGQIDAFDAGMPELPAALQGLVPVGVGHHPSHQAESAGDGKTENCYTVSPLSGS